jgi:hypothetical protein
MVKIPDNYIDSYMSDEGEKIVIAETTNGALLDTYDYMKRRCLIHKNMKEKGTKTILKLQTMTKPKRVETFTKTIYPIVEDIDKIMAEDNAIRDSLRYELSVRKLSPIKKREIQQEEGVGKAGEENNIASD